MLSLFAIARFMVIRNATAFDSEVLEVWDGTGRPPKKDERDITNTWYQVLDLR
jgi:hypothetical protein